MEMQRGGGGGCGWRVDERVMTAERDWLKVVRQQQPMGMFVCAPCVRHMNAPLEKTWSEAGGGDTKNGLHCKKYNQKRL